jgi:hypothetical protein
VFNSLRKNLRSDSGNAESAMVLLPLLTLALIGLQLTLTVHTRNSISIKAQSEASTRAISGQYLSTHRIVPIESAGDTKQVALLVTNEERPLQLLLPSLLGKILGVSVVGVKGFSVMEK